MIPGVSTPSASPNSPHAAQPAPSPLSPLEPQPPVGPVGPVEPQAPLAGLGPQPPYDDGAVPPLPAGTGGGAPAARPRKLGLMLVAVPVGVALGLAGALGAVPYGTGYLALFAVGVLAGVSVFNLLSTLLAGFSGLAPVYGTLGAGRRLGATTVRGRLLTVRMVPVVLLSTCLVLTDRPDLRGRLRRGAVVQLVVQLAVAGGLAAVGGAPGVYFGVGLGFITVLIFTSGAGKVTSPAWRLWRLRAGEEEAKLDEWRVDPATLAAARAAALGRIDLMRAALAGAPPSGSPRRQALGITLALAEGRSDVAAREALALRERSHAPSLRLAALQLYAMAVSDGVYAGRWRPQEALPHFAAALAALRAEGSVAALRGTDLAAREALFQGRPARAVALAGQAAATSPDALSRATALHTLASAHTAMARPTNAAAAAAKSAALLHF
jgi:hypothetical protein